MLSAGGSSARASAIRSSSSVGSSSSSGSVAGSTGPRCLALGSMASASGGCSGTKTLVASLPAAARMTAAPPGWTAMNSVTSYTLPAMMTQQSERLLCFCTSS
jgi:hypothetical protein